MASSNDLDPRQDGPICSDTRLDHKASRRGTLPPAPVGLHGAGSRPTLDPSWARLARRLIRWSLARSLHGLLSPIQEMLTR